MNLPKSRKSALIVFTIVFILSWLPIALSILNKEPSPPSFSIYNTNWDGCSKFRDLIENEGFQVKTLISSLSMINRIEQPAVLVIIGPSKYYSPSEIIPTLLLFLQNGGGILIADDFGSSNTILQLLFQFQIQFSDKVLMDAGSYVKNPVLPVITNFAPHPITDGINSILLNHASAIVGPNDTSLILLPPIATTTRISWLDTDQDYEYDANEPVGPFVVATAVDIFNGSIVILSDASIFINDMIERADNARFALNIINWLSDNNKSATIIFDESHLAWSISSPTVYFGTIIGYVAWLSAIPYLSLLLPFFMVFTVKKWIPVIKESKKFEPLKIFRRRGRTAFLAKIKAYKTFGFYDKALKMLYNRFKRIAGEELKFKLGFSLDKFLEQVSKYCPDLDTRKIRRILLNFEKIDKGKLKVTSRDQFLKLFFQLKKIEEEVEKIGGKKR